MNASPATPALALDRISTVAFFAPNQTELAILTGRPTGSRAEAADAARTLVDAGIATVIVTLGADGALLVDRDGTLHIPSVPVTAVDTTGAGDAFIGAFAHGVATLGLDQPSALARAAAYAAHSVTGSGAQSSFASEEIFETFRKHAGVEP